LKNKVLTVFFLIILTFSWLFYVQPLKAEDSLKGFLICKKTETLNVKYAPTGELIDKLVSVRFEIYNNGSSPVTVNVIDRVENVNSSTISVLYGTPEYSKLERFGNVTKITWENVTVESGKSVRYQYSAESLIKPPIDVDVTLLLNGKPTNITKMDETYFINANLSDVVSIELKMKNAQTPLYIADNRTAVQPLLCTTSLALSDDYFSGIKSSPNPNSTTVFAGKTVMTWITFLGNETQTYNASATVSNVGSWGEITIDPITIQVSSSSETLKSYFTNMINGLNSSLELIRSFVNSSEVLSEQTLEMSKILKGVANGTESLGNTTMLVNMLLLVSGGLKTADSTLSFAQESIIQANVSLVNFMFNNETVIFLQTHQQLNRYLVNAIANLTAAYKIIDMVRYGNATVPGLSQLADKISETAEIISSSGTVLQNMTKSLNELADSLFLISVSANETKLRLESSLKELNAEKTRLEDVLLTLNYKVVAHFNLEVKPEEKEENYIWQSTIKKVNGKWSVTAINISNPSGLNRTIYGLKLSIETNETVKPFVEVSVDGKWQRPVDMKQLGITGNILNNTFYLTPKLKVKGNSTRNVLVDWLGRPIRIILDCEKKPDVSCEFDVASLYENIQIEPSEGQVSYTIAQPQLVVQNFTIPPIPKPETQPKTLSEIIMEYLQKPEVQLVITLIVVSVIIIIGFSRRKRKVGGRESPEIKAEVESLLKEIEKVRENLEKEEK